MNSCSGEGGGGGGTATAFPSVPVERVRVGGPHPSCARFRRRRCGGGRRGPASLTRALAPQMEDMQRQLAAARLSDLRWERAMSCGPAVKKDKTMVQAHPPRSPIPLRQ